jgi:hypothetical protein
VAAHTVTGAEELLRVIHRSPTHIPPPVLLPPNLPPRPVPPSVVWCRDLPIDVAPSIEIHLVPGEPVEPYAPEVMRRAVSAVARLDAAGSTAWAATEEGEGVAVLIGGQRSAWFTPPHRLDRSQLAAAVAKHVALLTEIDLARPTSWLPAIGAGPTQIVLPRMTNQELHPTELAAQLANKVTKEDAPRVTNVVNGNVSGMVIQAGDIQGGLHL